MILYPTETLYAIGVNALDEAAVAALYELKGREANKASSWLVRDVEDIKRWGILSEPALKITQHFLPGPLTLVVPAKADVPDDVIATDGTVSFRVSKDSLAQSIIMEYMAEHDVPLTCTSANVSGCPTLPTVSEILQQFGPKAGMFEKIYDDGVRKGLASTVVRVIGDGVTILREGSVTETSIRAVC